MRPLSWQARSGRHQDIYANDSLCRFTSLPLELRRGIIDAVVCLFHDGGSREEAEKRLRLLTSLRATCSTFAYDPYLNSFVFETVSLSCRPPVLHLLRWANLSHVLPHVRRIEFCQTMLDWQILYQECQLGVVRASTKLGQFLQRRRLSNAFHRCVNEIDEKPCFRAEPYVLYVWTRVLLQVPHVRRVTFKYRAHALATDEVIPRRALIWVKRRLRPEEHTRFYMKWHMHITQVFFTTLVASLVQSKLAIEELSVQHTLYPTFRWEQIPDWQDLDFSRLRKLDYSSFSSTWTNVDRTVGLPVPGPDRLERLENFTSILRQCCHSLEELTVDARWYSAADPTEYIMLPWPDDYSLSFPRLTDLRLRRVRLRWHQAARYLERMPALQRLSYRDACQLRPKASKPLWDVIRQREHKPRIETGYRTSSRVIYDPDLGDELPPKFRKVAGSGEKEWEVQKRAQLWMYLAGTGRWTPLLDGAINGATMRAFGIGHDVGRLL